MLFEDTTLRMCFINEWADFTPQGVGILYDVIAENYNVTVVDDHCDVVISSVFAGKEPEANSMKIFYVGETLFYNKTEIHINPNQWDLSFGYEFIEHEKYLRLPLYYLYFADKISDEFVRPQCNPNKEYFACFLFSHEGQYGPKYYEGARSRSQLVLELMEYQPVVSGAAVLNNMDAIVPQNKTLEFLGKCKFVVAFENHMSEGYMSEKLPQAYIAGSVPIYYGHNSSFADINTKAFIYAQDFETNKELIARIAELDQDDEQYCEIYNQVLFNQKEKSFVAIKDKVKQMYQKLFEQKLPINKQKSLK